MNAKKHWLVCSRIVLVVVLAGTACKKKDETKSGDTSNTTVATTEAKTEPAKGGVGIDDPANDKAVVALAKEAVKCKWSGGWGLKSDCPAYQAFTKAEPVKTGKVDATLMNFLVDPAKEVRWLGATGLYNWGTEFKKNVEMAKKVLAAARAEKEPGVSGKMGDVVGKIDVTKTGLTEDVKKLLAESDNSAMRRGIVGGILWTNREAGFYEVVQQIARTDKDMAVRKAAAASFWVSGHDRHDDTCKLWLELSAEADDDLSGHSAYHCGFWSHGGGCTAQWDELLDNIEKRSKEGKVKSSMMSASLGYLYKQKKASAAQKNRVLAIARAMVENTGNGGMSRGGALEMIGKNDPAGGKAFAAKFENDKEFFVKNAVKKIKEGKE